MATVAETLKLGGRPDFLSGTPRAHAIDRWIFVMMAAWFVALVLAGFIPSSLTKIAAVQAGERPPFPLVLHAHAVLMGSFLLLVLAQTWLAASGRNAYHFRLGLLALVLTPALVVVGVALAATFYHQLWDALQSAPPEAHDKAERALRTSDNAKLRQFRVGLLFPLFIAIGLLARRTNAGLHKRMMILATAVPLSAGIDRIPWLPHAMPLSPDLFTLLAISPMFAWDVIRNRRMHEAYLVWIAINAPFAIAVYALWDSDWWHATVPRLMGV